MEIQTQERAVQKNGGGRVTIATNLIRESERFDRDGNVIDPRTKQIIKPANAQNNESILHN